MDSNVTGGNTSPISLVAAEKHSLASEMQNAISNLQLADIEHTKQFNLVQQQLKKIEQESANKIADLVKTIVLLEEDKKQILANVDKKVNQILELQNENVESINLRLEAIGSADLNFELKSQFIDTKMFHWKKEHLVYISFGRRIEVSPSIGGGSIIPVQELKALPPAKEHEDASSAKVASMTLGTCALQATSINAQVYIGRTENYSLLVAANNANAGSFPIILYAFRVDNKET